MRIGLLMSGKLGYNTLLSCLDFVTPEFIATDRNSDEIIDYARKNSLPLFMGNPRQGKLIAFLKHGDYSSSLLLSINYVFLLEWDVISRFKLAVNLHGSLLPKYRGRAPHIWAIINNEKEAGLTLHKIDTGCDTGEIILQEKIDIDESDTGADIVRKYEKMYPQLIKTFITQVRENSISETIQDEDKATFFSKRNPDDGLINWNWHKERIRNWVRALADPYPGAFSFMNGKKVVIDKITFSDFGFSDTMKNGLVLNDNPIIVKTPNGAIELVDIRKNRPIIKKNKYFENGKR